MSPHGRPLHSAIQRATVCVLLLSELCSCTLYKYHFFAEPMTWYEAKNYCKQMYKNLAFPENVEDMKQVIAAAGSGYQGDVWIGLRDRYSKWWWSTPYPNPYINSPYINFRIWAMGQPNAKRWNRMLCVVILNGFWHDVNCNSMFSSVCHNNTQPQSNQSYTYVKEAKTWQEAQANCRKYHTDLARVRNATENQHIQALVPKDVAAFIGMYRFPWSRWANGASNTFKYWANGHPLVNTYNCAASVIDAEHEGHWVEKSCQSKKHFVCYSDQTRVFRLELKFTVDLKNDPVLKENVIKEIEARLKKKGFTRDFKLSWI